jgi:polyphenol oxidase
MYAWAVLVRRESESNVVWYESPLLAAAGVPHAFSTRLGGVSRPPFDSLNFGNPAGEMQDPAVNIDANYARLLQAIGAPDRKVHRVHQVHGGQIVSVPCDNNCKADGIIVTDPALFASVRTADCVPVLLATQDGSAAAAVHAGWRGVVAGVVIRAVDALRGLRPGAAILAAIGPCIGRDAFEVGPEVVEAFVRADGLPVGETARGKAHIDLRAAIAVQLQHHGVEREQMEISDRCTVRDRSEFFSHRRDNGITGRMVSLIGPR